MNGQDGLGNGMDRSGGNREWMGHVGPGTGMDRSGRNMGT